jgi:cyclophilin family peptidyl-prolyl cis-trans isomerase
MFLIDVFAKLCAVLVVFLCLSVLCASAYAAEEKPARPVAEFETSMGNIKVELFYDLAPKTCRNFMDLAERNFFDGVIFHRVIDGFMIQGGDPTGTGTGGPGYVIPDEFGEGLAHDSAGILSMANAGPNSGGSQFFITLAPTPWLDGKHAIFGRVIGGMKVVEAIGHVATGRNDKPIRDVVIKKLSISGDPAKEE